jgi:hypothetical protein
MPAKIHESPLHIACAGGYLEFSFIFFIIIFIIILIISSLSVTKLLIIYITRNPNIVALLLYKGADMNRQNTMGATGKQLARSPEVLEVFIIEN